MIKEDSDADNLRQLVNVCNAPQFTHLVFVLKNAKKNQLTDNLAEHFRHTGSISKTPLFYDC